MVFESFFKVDKGLENILNDFLKNNQECSFGTQGIITLIYDKEQQNTTPMFPFNKENLPIVTLYIGSQYARFYNEFIQTARNNPEFKQLINYLNENEWKTNLK
jgi:hypothetical protein